MVNKTLFGQMQNSLNQIRTFAERLIRSDAEFSIFGNIQAIRIEQVHCNK